MKKRLEENKRIVFGELLKKNRNERNLTLAEVSEKSGVPVSTMSHLECGNSPKISMAVLEMAATLYDLDIDLLCQMTERIPPDIYYKIVENPKLFNIIREIEV